MKHAAARIAVRRVKHAAGRRVVLLVLPVAVVLVVPMALFAAETTFAARSKTLADFG